MKTCYQCQKTKLREEFYEDKHSLDGVTSSCKECQKERAAEYYQARKDKLTDGQKEARRAAYLKWKANNPERFKELSKKHNSKKNERLAD